ncbi:META domain-containing protein [Neptunomonas japonica]|uniref:META domain-containing protein n=1 Tax=Neptunomonas japonica TaxID=417574 RepID=UPI0005699C62|nr:META domain-containing protein [Neptunomonas japonica]
MLRIVCAFIFSLLIVGCQTTSNLPAKTSTSGTEITTLDNTSWIVQSVAGRGLMEYLSLTLNFKSDSEVEGFSGCNRFKGQYEIINSRLEIGPLASTRKYCSKVIMYQEHLLLNELSQPLTLSQMDNRVIQLINNKSEVTRLMMQ